MTTKESKKIVKLSVNKYPGIYGEEQVAIHLMSPDDGWKRLGERSIESKSFSASSISSVTTEIRVTMHVDSARRLMEELQRTLGALDGGV
tara:strand:+ start:1112 stop:1381 length:270 start_codon:yes stop_codon:yes gene_type:complete